MEKLQFIQEDFIELEKKYPQAYWFIRVLATERIARELQVKLAELTPQETE